MSERGTQARWERGIFAACCVAALAAVGLVAVYWRGGHTQIEGVLLAVGFGSLGWALVAGANKVLHRGTFAEPRHRLDSPPPEREAVGEAIDRNGTVHRRSLLVRGLVIAAGGLGVATLVPLRSLGRRPLPALRTTAWQPGLRLVTAEGRSVRADEVPDDGLVTAYPEGNVGSADSQVVVVRVNRALLRLPEDRRAGAPDGLIAYSKVCTHAGCPVGLYQPDVHQLLCPCHQSAFDVLDGAKPVFGPAAAPLPQLPLRIDDDGVLRAVTDFPEPVGPAFWTRG